MMLNVGYLKIALHSHNAGRQAFFFLGYPNHL
jgi:hypothetical protein